MDKMATLRFRLLIIWVAILRLCVPYGMGNRLAARTVYRLHPMIHRQKSAFIRGLEKVLGDRQSAEQAWQRHLALVGVNRFQSSFYAQPDTSWIGKCRVRIEGAELVHASHRLGRGVLTMTYHHHFNMLFCNLLGRLDLPITTIAMDARDDDRYRKFGGRVDRIYDHAEKLLNGGDIILVRPQSQMRPILRAFDNNHLVITANDFPEVFDDKNRLDLPFLGTTLSCPTGTVKLAVRKNIPIVAAYLDWLERDRFKLVIRRISDGTDDMTVETAMGRYLGVLEDMIATEPGLWEGWKWL